MSLARLRESEYAKRLEVTALRREVYRQADPSVSESLLDALQQAERELSGVEQQRAAAQAADPRSGLILTAGATAHEVRGVQTTGLEATATLRMAQLPTSIHHLLERARHPLVTFTARSVGYDIRRLRFTSFVEGYSARSVDVVELPAGGDGIRLDQLPTLFPDRLRSLTELTTATVNVMVEDLDGKVELHRTETVPLLARTAVPLAIMDPGTGQWCDLSRYLGAFVTPNTPAVMTFLREVARHHPDGRLIGYQGSREGVTDQVKAVFDALTAIGIVYVNSVVAFSPEEGTSTQRVRLPRESLADREANCIDGTVLVASLLEAMSMHPAIVIVPGHAFVGWETWPDSGEWRYLETTMIDHGSFEQACLSAERTAERYRQLRDRTGDPFRFRVWTLRTLRSVDRITPME
jgi:hypothetical protein